GLPRELLPPDVAHQTVVKQTVLADRLARSPSPVAQFVADFTVHGFASESGGLGGLVMHDPLAMGVALDPSLVGFEPHHVVVECQGQTTRGLSVGGGPPAGIRSPSASAELSRGDERRRGPFHRHLPGSRVPRVTVVGSANVDFTVALSRLPRPGETVTGGTLLVNHGGKGANQAVAARRLGAEVRFIGCVGDDSSG